MFEHVERATRNTCQPNSVQQAELGESITTHIRAPGSVHFDCESAGVAQDFSRGFSVAMTQKEKRRAELSEINSVVFQSTQVLAWRRSRPFSADPIK